MGVSRISNRFNVRRLALVILRRASIYFSSSRESRVGGKVPFLSCAFLRKRAIFSASKSTLSG